MADQEYRSNSDRSKASSKVQRVVTGNTVQKKKGVLDKIANVFISSDVTDVKQHVIYDVIIPTAKRTFLDALAMLLGTQPVGRNGTQAARASYRSYYGSNENNNANRNQQRKPSIFDYNDILYETRADAEAVLNGMFEHIDSFDAVSISDMYEMSNQECAWTGQKYGWTELNGAHVERVSGGYVLRLPKAGPL